MGAFISKIPPKAYLKWNNTTIGEITVDNEVEFVNKNLNSVVSIYTKGKTKWTSAEFKEFLTDRVVDKDRRDIERILYRCNLSEYDVFEIGYMTRAMNPKDLFWIAHRKDETMDDTIKDVFFHIFDKSLDDDGHSIYSPGGMNVKWYGTYNDKYGIFKKRLNPKSGDVESEVAVYRLAKLLGIDCCPAYLVNIETTDSRGKIKKETVAFSEYRYDFTREHVVHVRRFLKQDDRTKHNGNEYLTLVDAFKPFKTDIQKMIILDFVTRQTDRHWSNFALKITNSGDAEFYPHYDNGRSLFFEDNDDTISDAIKDIETYSTEFGIVGTYFDYVNDISLETKISELVNLDIDEEEIYLIYKQSGFKGYRLEGATRWTYGTLQYLKEL